MNVDRIIKLIGVSSILLWGNQTFAMGVGNNVMEGIIKGANCHMSNRACPTNSNDPHMVMESDFVLVTNDSYYFLPNMARFEKVHLINKSVRIRGDWEKNAVDVDKVQVKNDGAYQAVWERPFPEYD